MFRVLLIISSKVHTLNTYVNTYIYIRMSVNGRALCAELQCDIRNLMAESLCLQVRVKSDIAVEFVPACLTNKMDWTSYRQPAEAPQLQAVACGISIIQISSRAVTHDCASSP